MFFFELLVSNCFVPCMTQMKLKKYFTAYSGTPTEFERSTWVRVFFFCQSYFFRIHSIDSIYLLEYSFFLVYPFFFVFLLARPNNENENFFFFYFYHIRLIELKWLFRNRNHLPSLFFGLFYNNRDQKKSD